MLAVNIWKYSELEVRGDFVVKDEFEFKVELN